MRIKILKAPNIIAVLSGLIGEKEVRHMKEFEIEITYGVYNGGTPIFSGIESFAKAQAVFYNTAKACNILGLRCDLVNETTGEVVE